MHLTTHTMTDQCSLSSPRRIVYLSKKRAVISDKDAGFGLSGKHGPKSAEVYGFVGSITTIVVAVIFFIWAYFPKSWLHALGICYYPSRYWAVAAPTYIMVSIFCALCFYIGLNFISSPSPHSTNSIFDEHSRDEVMKTLDERRGDVEDHPIDPIFDVPLCIVNDLMFNPSL